METYKHFVSISSQLYFCSSPIRLDSYNRCQFGCIYCFSRKRARVTSDKKTKQANPTAFAKRMERVRKGIIQSALDEFLSARVPIQFGGMQDPFTPMERTRKVTLQLLRVLNEHNYPTLISTKGDLYLQDEYWNELCNMDVYLRLSAAAVPERKRSLVDSGADNFQRTLKKIRTLSQAGFSVSLRIQPVFPGFEDVAIRMAERAADAGVSHVSFEYLKIATEDVSKQSKIFSRILGVDVLTEMHRRGIKRTGRDYALRTEAKVEFLRRARARCSELGVYFGAGDTEFIHLSDGLGCCNGSSLTGGEHTQFRANFTGVLADRKLGDLVKFSDLANYWHPKRQVHTYLTTDSRRRDMSGRFDSWFALLAHRWNGGRGPYSPSFFYGVNWTGEVDEQGFKIYNVENKL